MRITSLPKLAVLAILAALIQLCSTLSAQEPTCDGCGAQSVGGSISHFPGCPYGGWGGDDSDEGPDTDEPASEPEPWIPPPESKFEREKRELLNRLSGSSPTKRSFKDQNRDLLSRMQTGAPDPQNKAKARLEALLSRSVSHPDPAVAAAAGELVLKTSATVAQLKQAIDQRRAEYNADVQTIIEAIKSKLHPQLNNRFDNLRVGDVILVRPPEDLLSKDYYLRRGIRFLDNVLSKSLTSRAYHTFLFVKEVNGVKLFLDNMPSQGTLVKTETQILAEYGSYHLDVAQPVGDIDAENLWNAAREAGLQSAKVFQARSENYIDKTDYGFKDEDMVCSETSRWALMRAGLAIPETRSDYKRLAMDFGPADFYLDTEHFVVIPLSTLRPRPIKASESK